MMMPINFTSATNDKAQYWLFDRTSLPDETELSESAYADDAPENEIVMTGTLDGATVKVIITKYFSLNPDYDAVENPSAPQYKWLNIEEHCLLDSTLKCNKVEI
jgi:hypothetical protein